MERKKQYNENVKLTIDCLKDYFSPQEYKQLGSYCLSEYANLELRDQRGFVVAPVCPHCKSTDIVKYGKSCNKQRYYCKACNKFFSENSQTMLEGSQIDTALWLRLIDLVVKGNATLEEIASLCHLRIQTVFFTKLRIAYAIELLNAEIQLSNVIQADELEYSYNAKGQKFDFINRKPRKRGGCNTLKNRNENSICIVVAVEKELVEDRTRIVSKIAGFGKASKKRIFNALEKKISPNDSTILVTDGSKAYSLLAEQKGIEWKRIITQKKGKKRVPGKDGIYNIQVVNAYHSKLRNYLNKSRGISTKYLPAHLEIFDFSINYGYLSAEEQAFLILKKLLACPYHLKQNDLTKHYYLPSYQKQIAENWRKYFTKEEVSIYRAIKKGAIKKDLIEKYGTSYKRIRTLVKKIDSLQAEIETAKKTVDKKKQLKEISDLDWQIYTLYKTGKYTYAALASQFGYTIGGIGAKIKRIDARPEGYEGIKKSTITQQTKEKTKKRKLSKQKKKQKQYSQIYQEFTLLCAGQSKMTLKDAYVFLGKKHNKSHNTIRNIVFQIRKNDTAAVWRKKGSRISPDFQHKSKQSPAKANEKYF